MAEGRVVIEKLVGSANCRLDSLLIAAQRLESLADVLTKLDKTTPVFAASQAVVDGIAGFALHRGLLARELGLGGCSMLVLEKATDRAPPLERLPLLGGIADPRDRPKERERTKPTQGLSRERQWDLRTLFSCRADAITASAMPRIETADQPPAVQAPVAAAAPPAPPRNIEPMKMVFRRERASGRSA